MEIKKIFIALFALLCVYSAVYAQQLASLEQKPHANVVLLGEENAGKSTLAHAITYSNCISGFSNQIVDVDMINNTSDEMLRGKTLYTHHILTETDRVRYHLFDCPGSEERFNQITSLFAYTKIDGAILVFSATDDWEIDYKRFNKYVKYMRMKNTPWLIVYLNKCDMVDDEDTLQLEEKSIKDILNASDYNNVPIIRGSALGAINNVPEWLKTVKELMNYVDSNIIDSK